MSATQAYSGSGSALPYQGNAQQGNVLAALNDPSTVGTTGATGTSGTGGTAYGFDPTTGATTIPYAAGTPGTQATPTPQSQGWIDYIFEKLGNLAARGALLTIGLILLVGAMLIFAHQNRS